MTITDLDPAAEPGRVVRVESGQTEFEQEFKQRWGRDYPDGVELLAEPSEPFNLRPVS